MPQGFIVLGFAAALTWNTLLLHNQMNAHPHRSERWLYGGVFSLQTVISELLVWVATLWGYIFYQSVGQAQGRRMDCGKWKQWMIEITQSSASHCNCVGMFLCLPGRKEIHLWSDISCPRVTLKPRLKGTGRNRWEKVNAMSEKEAAEEWKQYSTIMETKVPHRVTL